MDKFQSVSTRFLKGLIAGAVSSMGMVSYQNPTVWLDFSLIFNALGVAAVAGAITGLLLAIQKWASWEE